MPIGMEVFQEHDVNYILCARVCQRATFCVYSICAEYMADLKHYITSKWVIELRSK